MLAPFTPSSFFSYFLFLFYDFVSFILSPLRLSGGAGGAVRSMGAGHL